MITPRYDYALERNEDESSSIRLLRESYGTAKTKAAEFSVSNNLALHLRVHGQQAARVYSALSTLLYASISVSKADELEKFIKKKASQLPMGVFDLEEWSKVINVAHRCRHGDSRRLLEEYKAYKKLNESRLVHVEDITNGMFDASSTLKSTVRNELDAMRQDMKRYSDKILPAIVGTVTKIENVKLEKIKENEKLTEELKLSNEKVDQLQKELEDTVLKAEKDLNDKVNELNSAHADEMKALREAHDIENATNLQILEETKATHEEEKKALQLKCKEADDRLLALIKSYDEQHQRLVAQYESQIQEKMKSEAAFKEHHTNELAAASSLLQRTVSDLESKHIAHATKIDAIHKANNDDLMRQIHSLEKLHNESVKLGQEQLEAEKQRSAHQLVAVEAANAGKLHELNLSHQETVTKMQNQITMLEKMHQEAVEHGKHLQEAEVQRSLALVAAEVALREDLKTEHSRAIHTLQQHHETSLEDLRKQISHLDHLHKEAVETGKLNVDAETRRGQELVNAEIVLRKEMEANNNTKIEHLEGQHKAHVDELTNNFTREIDRLEKLHQEAVETGKANTEMEEVRGKGQLAAAEAAYTVKLAKAEETHAAAVVILKEEIEHLKKLHAEAIDTGKHNTAAEIARAKEQRDSAEATFTLMINKTQENNAAQLAKTTSDFEAKLLRTEEAHAASVEHYKSEIIRLEKLRTELVQRAKDQLATEKEHSKRAFDEEVARGNARMAATIEAHTEATHKAEADHASAIARERENQQIAAENFKLEIARLEKLHQEAVETGKANTEMEEVRGKGQLAAAEAAYTVKLAKAEETHAAAVVILKEEIEHLKKLHAEAIEEGKHQLATEKSRSKEELDAEVTRASLALAALEASNIIALNNLEKVNNEKLEKQEENHRIVMNNLKEEVSMLTNKHDEAVKIGQKNVDAEVERSKELVAAEVVLRGEMELQHKHAIDAINDHFKTETDRLERLHQEAVETGKANTEMEEVRGKGQLAAAEAAYTVKLAKAEETHAAAVVILKEEIEHLKKLHAEAIDTGKHNTEAEASRGRELVAAEVALRKEQDTERLAQIAALELKHKSAIDALTEHNNNEVHRLERLHQEAVETGKANTEMEEVRGKGQLAAAEAAYTVKLAKAEETHAAAVVILKEEIEHLKKLHAEAIENSNRQLDAERKRCKELMEQGDALARERVTATETAYNNALHTLTDLNKDKLNIVESTSTVSMENLKREIARLEKLQRDTVEHGKRQLEAEIARSNELLAAAESSHAAMLSKDEQTYKSACDNLKEELARMEKLYHEAVANGKAQTEAEILRSKAQLAEAEAAYTANLTKTEEIFAIAAENFKREIDRLEKMHQEATETGHQQTSQEKERGKEALAAEVKRSKESLAAMEALHILTLSKAEDGYKSNLRKSEATHAEAVDNFKREITRLEKLLHEANARNEQQRLLEEQHIKEAVDAETVRQREIQSAEAVNHSKTMLSQEESFNSKLLKVEEKHAEIVENLKVDISRLEKLHAEVVDRNKRQHDAEISRCNDLLVATQAAHAVKLSRADEAHAIQAENFKREIARIEQLYHDAVKEGKQEVALERLRSEQLVKAETNREKEMIAMSESAYAAALVKAETVFKEKLYKEESSHAAASDNYMREIRRLEELLQESQENAKRQVQAEEERSNQSLLAAAAAHATIINKLEENRNITTETLKREIVRLEKLHQDAVEQGKAAVQAEILRSQEQTSMEAVLRKQLEAEHSNAIAKLEKQHKNELALVLEGKANEIARLEQMIENAKANSQERIEADTLRAKGQIAATTAAYTAKLHKEESTHAVVVENYEKEIERLQKLLQESSNSSQQLSSQEQSRWKERLDAEIARSKESLAAAEAVYASALARAEASHLAVVAKMEASNAFLADNHRREVAVLEKLHLEAIESGKHQIALEAERSKTQLAEKESVYNAMIAKSESIHKDVVDNLKVEISRLHQLYRDNLELERGILQSQAEIGKQTADSEALSRRELVAGLESSHANALKKVEETHEAKLRILKETSTALNDQLRAENERLEKRLQDQIAVNKQQTDISADRSKTSLVDAESIYRAKLAAVEENQTALVTNFEREIARLEKLQHDVSESSKQQVLLEKERSKELLEAEKVRSKESLAAAEAIYTSSLANMEENHKTNLIHIEEKQSRTEAELRQEIVRLEKISQEVIELGKDRAVNDANHGKSQMASVVAVYTAKLSKAEEVHAATLENHKAEIARLEKELAAAKTAAAESTAAAVADGKRALAAEIALRKEREAEHAQILAQMDVRYHDSQNIAKESFKREIDRLEKMSNDPVLKKEISRLEQLLNEKRVENDKLRDEISTLEDKLSLMGDQSGVHTNGLAAGGKDTMSEAPEDSEAVEDVDFTVRLANQHLDTFDEGKQRLYREQVAAKLGVPLSKVKISGLAAGSVIISTKVDGLQSAEESARVKSTVNSTDIWSSLGLHFGAIELKIPAITLPSFMSSSSSRQHESEPPTKTRDQITTLEASKKRIGELERELERVKSEQQQHTSSPPAEDNNTAEDVLLMKKKLRLANLEASKKDSELSQLKEQLSLKSSEIKGLEKSISDLRDAPPPATQGGGDTAATNSNDDGDDSDDEEMMSRLAQQSNLFKISQELQEWKEAEKRSSTDAQEFAEEILKLKEENASLKAKISEMSSANNNNNNNNNDDDSDNNANDNDDDSLSQENAEMMSRLAQQSKILKMSQQLQEWKDAEKRSSTDAQDRANEIQRLKEEIATLQDKISLMSVTNERVGASVERVTESEAPGDDEPIGNVRAAAAAAARGSVTSEDDVSNPDLEQARLQYAEEILAMKKSNHKALSAYEITLATLRADVNRLEAEVKVEKDEKRRLSMANMDSLEKLKLLDTIDGEKEQLNQATITSLHNEINEKQQILDRISMEMEAKECRIVEMEVQQQELEEKLKESDIQNANILGNLESMKKENNILQDELATLQGRLGIWNDFGGPTVDDHDASDGISTTPSTNFKNTVSALAEDDVEPIHEVDFTVKIINSDLESFGKEEQKEYREFVATKLKVHPSQVILTKVSSGSVILATRVTGLANEGEVIRIQSLVNEKDKLLEGLISKYGDTVLTSTATSKPVAAASNNTNSQILEEELVTHQNEIIELKKEITALHQTQNTHKDKEGEFTKKEKELNQRIEELEDKLAKYSENQSDSDQVLALAVSNLETGYRRNSIQNVELTNTISALEQERDKLTDDLAELKAEHKKQLDALQDEISNLQDKVSLQNNDATTMVNATNHSATTEAMNEAPDTNEDDLSNPDLEQAKVNNAEELLAMKKQHILENTENQKEIGQLRAQIVVLETKQQQDQAIYEETRIALQSELSHVKEMRDLLEVEKNKLKFKEKQIEDLNATINTLEQERDKLTDDLAELKAEHKKQLDALQEEISNLQDKVSLQNNDATTMVNAANHPATTEAMNEAPDTNEDDLSNPDLEQAKVNNAEELLAMKKQHILENTENQKEIGQLRAQIVVLETKQQQDQAIYEETRIALQSELSHVKEMRDLLEVEKNKLKFKEKQIEDLNANYSQMEVLNKQYRAELKASESTLDSLKQELAVSSPSKDSKRYEETFTALQSEIKHVAELRDLLEREKHKVKIKEKHVEELLISVAQLENEKKDLRHSLHASASHRFRLSPRFSGSLSPRLDSKIAKLQAVVRGFMARIRMDRVRVHHAALSAGVLFALNNTVQGETGWYSSPNGSVFYFVAENGDYMLACGPLTTSEYESIINLSNDKRKQGQLIKCDLKLAMMDTEDDSEVYIAAKSKKLFLAVPVDGRCFLEADEVEKFDSVEEEENNNILNVIVT